MTGSCVTVRRVLREPLLHFLLLGLALFGLYAVVSPGDPDGSKIEIADAQVKAIDWQFRTTWNRPPTTAELDALVEQQVRDEIVFREGRAMGLDRDDAVIKRRVRQKYDLIIEDENDQTVTDAKLDAYRRVNSKRFMQPGVVTFDQLYFNSDAASAAAAAAAMLARGADAAGLGKPSPLPRHIEATPLDMVARDFGAGFASSVATAPLGRWAGPISSGFGLHVVRVNNRSTPVMPPLAEVRAAVEREWENERRLRAREANYARLRQQYDVTIGGLPGSMIR